MLLIPNYFKKNGFFIYSSHKTATQSLLRTFHENGYDAIHCHTLQNLVRHNTHLNNKPFITLKQHVLRHIHDFVDTHHQKLNIITVIRNPKQRLISSFFQSYYNDEITFQSIPPEKTTIMMSSHTERIQVYCDKIASKSLPGRVESLDEMSLLFDIQLVDSLTKYEDYYYYENNYVNIYVLDFDRLIQENIQYLNRVFKTNFDQYACDNISTSKPYHQIYNTMKASISSHTHNMIVSQYHPFYFNAFTST